MIVGPDPVASSLAGLLALPAPRVAPRLLGGILRHGGVAVRLTEVEAYAGLQDPASHAFRGPTPRTRVMFGPAGRLYVYFSYGNHCCANLVCGPDGEASAVLLRAGEVVQGHETAAARRGIADPDRLARGPGNLARALGLTLADTGVDLDADPRFDWTPPIRRPRVRRGPRVGVSRAADRPWRWWIAADPTVSAYRRSPRAAPATAPGPRRFD